MSEIKIEAGNVLAKALVTSNYLYKYKGRELVKRAQEGEEFAVKGGAYAKSLEEGGYITILSMVTATDPESGLEPSNDPIKKIDPNGDEETDPSGEPGSSELPDSPTSELPEKDYEPDGRLREVKGIGEKTESMLIEDGIVSLEALIDADAVELADALSESITNVQKWQAHAKDVL